MIGDLVERCRRKARTISRITQEKRNKRMIHCIYLRLDSSIISPSRQDCMSGNIKDSSSDILFFFSA
jgi:hypothetical protein